jgi:alpha,alpha-trehalase
MRAALILIALVLGCRPAPPVAPAVADALSPGRVAPVRRYIRDAWQTLTRSNRDLAVAARDPKFEHAAGAPWPVYLAPSEDLAGVRRKLEAALTPAQLQQLALEPLRPGVPPGLLYLPEPYVVPGGRFNEMYGWDSYFIVLGLLRDGQIERARQQTDDFLYEVERYGQVLNANRSYYLTRSQPPLLSPMVRAVYQATGDRAWLARAFAALVDTHRFWTTPPHLAGATGLSRYFDTGTGPAPEVVRAERDAAGRTHYDRVRAYYRAHDGPEARRYYDRARDALTPLFYEGDRSMRESGFDPSDRFGAFGAGVIDEAPVCLNVLLAVLEEDLAVIARALGRSSDEWEHARAARRQAIDRYLWDETSGLYFDWDFEAGARRPYPFATTFWPLWAGLASPTQAARVRANLPLFERAGGLLTSTRVSGNQWDAPFGWAPLQLFAVRGLFRYHFDDDARRLARAFASLIVEDFGRRGAIVEKYDVVRRSSQVESDIRFGYAENQIGFGWTNGVLLELLADLR